MSETKKIVVKIGSNVIAGNRTGLSRETLARLIGQMAQLRQKGYQIVLITSGAISSGREVSDLSNIADENLRRQALAALGQARLMQIYHEFFDQHKINVAQILVVREDFLSRKHFDNFQKTVETLLDHGIIPIINENDAIAVKEYAFLDNDQLAALTAVALGADYLINLTNIDGLYSADPKKDPTAKLIREVSDGGNKLEEMCSRDTSSFGSGGMLGKVRAASLAAKNGTAVIITNGLIAGNLASAILAKPAGTFFKPLKKSRSNRDKWLLLGASAKGKITIDDGAATALRAGKSLLAVGLINVSGQFSAKDIVEIVDRKGETLACGITAYSSKDLERVVKLRQNKDNESIKKNFAKEVIHVDNLTIL